MAHFIGGSAAFWIVMFFWGLERAKVKAFTSAGTAALFCWIGGLAAWGLMR